jgi:hypothetical protein
MSITERYVEFILSCLERDKKVQLMEPKGKNEYTYSKLGPRVGIPVKIEVLNKYTRSANLVLIFDKYRVEHLFFMPMESSPYSIVGKINSKVHNIVNDTFIDDGRENEIKQMYDEKRAFIKEQLIKATAKINKTENNTSDKIVE